MALLRISAAIAFIVVVAAASVGICTPKAGLVTVIGSAVPGISHADRGAPAQMQGLALKHSSAELGYCNVPSDGALDPLLASGVPIAVFQYTNQSQAQWYYNKGIRLFIFGNEPDWSWPSYGSILMQAYPIFQSLLPGSQVIGGNCFTTDPYIGLYQNYDFRNCCDMVGFHNYSDEPATGLNIPSVVTLHNIMTSYGDGTKKIFLGEGWGPKREVRACPRVSPDIPPSIQEIQQMRGFVVNGWHNLITAQGGYDPNWVYGALFFTLTDNWGFDFAHFYNGGLVDYCGNPKDDLLLLFPGDELTVANCGFEYGNPGDPWGPVPFWESRGGTSESCYAIDASIRHAGVRSQRLELTGTTEAYVSQMSESGSVSAGQAYTIAAWARTEALDAGAYAGARLGIKFYNPSGSQTSSTTWSTGLHASTDWTLLTVTATAPANSARLQLICDVQGTSGRAWFDDCSVSVGTAPQAGNIEGYVFSDSANHTLAGAQVVVQPGGLTTTSDSTGRFYLSRVPAGACEVTASKPGYGSKSVSRVVVAPGRTSIAGLHLRAVGSSSPCSVQAANTSVSGVLRISWEPPAADADFYRVYRATSPGSLGTKVFDNVTGLEVYDEGLVDYETYYYTVRAVLGGVESTNTQSCSGVPTGGPTIAVYDNNAPPDWSNWASQHGQTFVPTETGSIVSATCVLATAGSPANRDMTFSIREGGPTGPQMGPSRTVTCYSDEVGTATWLENEVPVVAGQTYCLRLDASSETAIYRSDQDVYSGGRYYMDGQPYTPSSDLWSTIGVAESAAPDVVDVTASNIGPGKMKITWETTAPTTSRVEYGPTAGYGSASPETPDMAARHQVVLSGLAAGSYHFRVTGSRPGCPDTISLDYTFAVPQAAVSVAEARRQADGSQMTITGVVSAIFQGSFYVQDADRLSGIRVDGDPQGLSIGDTVNLAGTLGTDASGERFLAVAASAQPLPPGD